MANRKKFRNFCFTAFGAEPAYCTEQIQYIIYGHEICPTSGREHWQGYCELKNAFSLTFVKNLFNDNTIHIEERRGTQKQAIDYCKKDGKWTEYGIPKKQGKRSDLEIDEIGKQETLLDVYEGMGFDKAIRYHAGVEKIYNLARNEYLLEQAREEITSMELYPWQKDCITDILSQPRRKISWYWEATGGVGKSHLVTYLKLVHGGLVLTSTSYKDCTYLYNNEELVIFDLPRSEYTPNYVTIEAFANYLLTSTKYTPCTKVSRARVVVFSNSPPDMSALSNDRWNIHQIKNP